MDLHEECGVIGVSLSKSSSDIIHHFYLGLFSLQHRGQESCGIAFHTETHPEGASIEVVKSKGLVANEFYEILPRDQSSSAAIGHVRYSTCGASNLVNAQPFVFNCNKGEIAIAHNGNIPKSVSIKSDLIQSGSIIQTSSDSEILIHLMARVPGNDFESSLISSLNQLEGAYAMLLLRENTVIAFRDPYGFRPLCYGEIDGGIVFASEDAALNVIGAKNIKDVEPGEIIFCKDGVIEKKRFRDSKKKAQCVFELIYFARPDSTVFSENVYNFRIASGKKLAQSRKADTDVVISVPDSGNAAALGFAKESGIPFEMGLMRNHYAGRTFIKPGQKKREDSVRIKLNPIASVIKDKTVSVIDDSLVRGTTSRKIVKMLKEAGAKEIHMYLSSPGITHSCFFGIDTPTRGELISSTQSPDEIAKTIGADSVTFLSISDLRDCLKSADDFCYACFDGGYPIDVE